MLIALKDRVAHILQFVASGSKLGYAAFAVGLLLALIYYKLFFRNRSNFEEDGNNASKIPLLDRDFDYVDSKWGRMKIVSWILTSIGTGFAAYPKLPQWFPHFFR